jgi:large conductance mechanosensitive channel
MPRREGAVELSERTGKTMGILAEFRQFAVKGNVIDMAVGIVIGAAFGKVVSSFVSDVITPPIGLAVGGVDFSNLKLTLKEAQGPVAAVTIKYGVFVQSIFDFVIVATALFALVRVINVLKREAPPPPPPPTKQEELLTEIRDALKARPSA